MKQRIIATVLLASLSLAAPLFAQQPQAEQECQMKVEMTIQAVKAESARTGTEAKLVDLSIQDIRDIQQKYGSCVAAQEIAKRTGNR